MIRVQKMRPEVSRCHSMIMEYRDPSYRDITEEARLLQSRENTRVNL
jgi:hypothetical protein